MAWSYLATVWRMQNSRGRLEKQPEPFKPDGRKLRIGDCEQREVSNKRHCTAKHCRTLLGAKEGRKHATAAYVSFEVYIGWRKDGYWEGNAMKLKGEADSGLKETIHALIEEKRKQTAIWRSESKRAMESDC